jgi:hypothetical protein
LLKYSGVSFIRFLIFYGFNRTLTALVLLKEVYSSFSSFSTLWHSFLKTQKIFQVCVLFICICCIKNLFLICQNYPLHLWFSWQFKDFCHLLFWFLFVVSKNLLVLCFLEITNLNIKVLFFLKSIDSYTS